MEEQEETDLIQSLCWNSPFGCSEKEEFAGSKHASYNSRYYFVVTYVVGYTGGPGWEFAGNGVTAYGTYDTPFEANQVAEHLRRLGYYKVKVEWVYR